MGTTLDAGGLDGQRRTILVVEDNDLTREMVVCLLEDAYEVIEANDGLKGIALLRPRS